MGGGGRRWLWGLGGVWRFVGWFWGRAFGLGAGRVVAALEMLAVVLPGMAVGVLGGEAGEALVIEGARSVPEWRLRGFLRELDLATGVRLSRTEADDAAFFVKVFYEDLGFAGVEVSYEFDERRGVAVLRVAEGEEVRLGGMRFEGDWGDVERGRLRAAAEFAMRERAGRWVGGLRFSEAALDAAAVALGELLRREGYAEALVAWRAGGLERGARGVVFEGAAGPKFVVGEVSVKGLPEEVARGKGLEGWRRGLEGVVFREGVEVSAREGLAGLLAEEGYRGARVEGWVDFEGLSWGGAGGAGGADGERGVRRVRLDFVVKPGGVYRVGEVRVRGAKRTREWAVRRLAGLRSGERYAEGVRREALRRLWMTGAFGRVDVEFEEEAGVGVVDAVVALEEARARQASVAVGYAQWYGAFAEAEVSDRNLLGTLTRGMVGGLVSQKTLGLKGEWEAPFVFGLEEGGRVTGQLARVDMPGYSVSAVSGAVGLKREAGGGRGMSHRLEYQYRNFFDLRVKGLPADVEAPGGYAHAVVSWKQGWDFRDDAFVPVSGWLAGYEAGLGSRVLGGDLDVARLGVRGGVWVPWQRRTEERRLVPFTMVFGRAGVMVPFGGTDFVPAPERFYLGGANTVRGYQLDGMAPRDGDGEPVGGEAFFQGNVETQWPVGGGVYVVAFVDAGNLALRAAEMDLRETRFSAGGGLRFYTPIGAFFVDYGWNVVRREGDPVGAWQFGFGLSF